MNDLRDLLVMTLKEGKNASFRYIKNQTHILDFANYIAYLMEKQNIRTKDLDAILIIIRKYDYRYIPFYLTAYKLHKWKLVNMFHNLATSENETEANKIRYSIATARISQLCRRKKKTNVIFVNSLDDLLFSRNQDIHIYLTDYSYKHLLLEWISDINSNIQDYIEQQYDIPTPNALVSQGVIKEFLMPNGKEVVSKRNNVLKPNSFYREQTNYIEITKRFNNNPILLNNKSDKKKVWLRIASPFVFFRDGYSGLEFSLSIKAIGVLLHDLLINDLMPATYQVYLYHYRLILDTLYEKGIIWKDMAPRNIIVQEEENNITYHIFDFEKTQMVNHTISLEERIKNFRGQILAEELCTVCTLSEIKNCVSDYFNPDHWDFTSTKKIDFPPRDEVLEAMQKTEDNYIPLGEYNRKDYRIIKMREPKTYVAAGHTVSLGDLGFKVAHYLNCAGFADARKYENMLTSILITMENSHYYTNTIAMLFNIVDGIEYAFIKNEFKNIMNNEITYHIDNNILVLTKLLTSMISGIYSDLDKYHELNE